MGVLWYFVILALAVTAVVIMCQTEMLRDEITDMAAFQAARVLRAKNKNVSIDKISNHASFSLGRTQLAFWTIIIISSFLFVWVNSGFTKVPNITEVTLALLGIAAGTTIVAKMVDKNQADGGQSANSPSVDFLSDIVSDEKGPSIHRMQNVLWTLVVGAVYIVYVADHSMLPDQDTITPHLLALMGISSGAYLSLKVGENKPVNATNNINDTPPPPPVAQAPAPNGNVVGVVPDGSLQNIG